MKIYKPLFWITITILIITNSYWFYLTIDNAVGHHYYQISCDEYSKDISEFRKIFISEKLNKDETLEFLNSNNIKFEIINKGNNSIILFNSFSLVFDKKGNLTQ